jgi:integrase
LLNATTCLKHQAALSVAYGAGLRVAEVSGPKVSDIDSERMLLRIECGKGRQYRNAMLSADMLALLRQWRKLGRQQGAMHRFLLHVLPRGFHRIRHYGLLAGATSKSSLALARKLLAVASPPDDNMSEEPLDTSSPCPCCGGHMLVIETFASWRQPRAPPHGAASTGRNAP